MKFKSVSTGIVLGVISNLLVVSPNLIGNSNQVIAQDVSPTCPLPSEIAVTFLDSKCEAVTLKQPRTFYRYYSSDSNKYGRYLTTDKYKNNLDVIRKLALNQAWGNQATMRLKVTIPAGTTVYQGIVAPQTPASCYPGGGQQTFIKDSKDPNIKWSEGKSMTVTEFTCP
ncbi:hypothetical protein CLI64_01995 [Nostoc sp. CENA543]|uniref:hypothetical protein n=1 Tax=Nostoc sp. CENA543 TaxID=1869241 RepID=UPI000CA28C4D|nr:hypothetical protein [Nostoc sp. CENA543]AUS99261.1 hypothetical protein CLI64_01995 [Nostoc sp. CENA543]